MSTVLTIIKDALQDIGVIDGIDEPSAEDSAKALRAMNDLLDSWALQDLAVFVFMTTTYTLIANQASYTIGPAGNFSGVRPTEIFDCQVTYQTVDFPVSVIDNFQYNEIPLKTQPGVLPSCLTYDASFPLGSVTFWPVPSQALPVKLMYNRVIATTPVTLTTDMGLQFPPGYNRAFTKGLALELCPVFSRPASPELVKLAQDSMRAIKRKNKRNFIASYDPAMVDTGYWYTQPWVPIP